MSNAERSQMRHFAVTALGRNGQRWQMPIFAVTDGRGRAVAARTCNADKPQLPLIAVTGVR